MFIYIDDKYSNFTYKYKGVTVVSRQPRRPDGKSVVHVLENATNTPNGFALQRIIYPSNCTILSFYSLKTVMLRGTTESRILFLPTLECWI